MIEPLFWLGFSILLVAVSLTAVLVAAIPALQELARAARSAEKLFDTLRRDLPPTLEAIRLTGLEISDLTDDVTDGVKSAIHVAKQVDEGLDSTIKQTQKIQVRTRSVFAGVKAAWKTFARHPSSRSRSERLPTSQRRVMELGVREASPKGNRASVVKPDSQLSSSYPEASGQRTQDISVWQTNSEDIDPIESEDF